MTNADFLGVILATVNAILLTVTAFFLKATWERIERMETKVNDHGEDIAVLKATRRKGDT